MNDFEKFMEGLQNNDTVILQLQGVGEERFETKPIYMAIRELMLRQVPTKVKGISFTWESRVGNCPHCNGFVVQTLHPHCCPHPKCGGQALEW